MGILHWLRFRRRLPVNPGEQFIADWNRRVREQHDCAGRTSFYALTDDEFAASETKFAAGAWQSHFVGGSLAVYRNSVIPIRALFNSVMCLGLDSFNGAYPCPSRTLDDACAFKLRTLDAAIDETPTDLLALVNDISLPHWQEWSQGSAFLSNIMEESNCHCMHSITRHAYRLLAARLKCSKADFLAFQEAAAVISNHGLLRKNPDGHLEVNRMLQDFFPSLKRRRDAIVDRRKALEWRAETSPDCVVPDELIGISGFRHVGGG